MMKGQKKINIQRDEGEENGGPSENNFFFF